MSVSHHSWTKSFFGPNAVQEYEPFDKQQMTIVIDGAPMAKKQRNIGKRPIKICGPFYCWCLDHANPEELMPDLICSFDCCMCVPRTRLNTCKNNVCHGSCQACYLVTAQNICRQFAVPPDFTHYAHGYTKLPVKAVAMGQKTRETVSNVELADCYCSEACANGIKKKNTAITIDHDLYSIYHRSRSIDLSDSCFNRA